ncbi:MAG: PEP/pyruvate-binding domain-containing protein [Thermodesulfobacteriota bacterium]|jgi:pyruvate,water dikinase
MKKDKLIFWFEEIGQEYNDSLGKKGANLGEMVKLGVPVAPGFVISRETCRRFMAETGASDQISQLIAGFGKITEIGQCEKASHEIRSIIEEKEIPLYIRKEISSSYSKLCKRAGKADLSVSTRSGAPASRPGMFDTYLNVRGKKQVLRRVKEVWSSAFSTRAMWYRLTHDIPIDSDILGVTVQTFVNARTAGIVFTAEPVTGDTSVIVVEANWGLGEGVVSGTMRVDRFVLEKESLRIQETAIADKGTHFIAFEQGVETKDVPFEKRNVPCISEKELREVAGFAKFLEQRLGCPQDVEWAIDPDLPAGGNIYLFQTRPVRLGTQKPQNPMDRLLNIMVKRRLQR